MCGIIALLTPGAGTAPHADDAAVLVSEKLKRIQHRGPDEPANVHSVGPHICFGHARLSIVGADSGEQPFVRKRRNGVVQAMTINGEIYNHKVIREHLSEFPFKSATNDCEAVLALCHSFSPEDALKKIRGQFAFVWAETDHRGLRRWCAARDSVGIAPLYYARTSDGSLWFASEMKAISDVPNLTELKLFPPGCVMSGDGSAMLQFSQPRPYYTPKFLTDPESSWVVHDAVDYMNQLRRTLVKSVADRLMSDPDCEIACLLSGGLDSSLVASICASICEKPIHTFCVKMTPDAPDAPFAKMVADHIGSVHHEVEFSVQDGLKALPKVIWHLESCDTTSVRASTPMYLLCKHIKQHYPRIKVLMSGEGADEQFLGYLESHSAPRDGIEAGLSAAKRVRELHFYDLQRCNRSVPAHGLELRVPFLSEPMQQIALTAWPASRLPRCRDGHGGEGRRIEKFILRKAFDCTCVEFRTGVTRSYLPDSVLWRVKEQMSDAVGYGWIDCLKNQADAGFNDPELFDECEATFGRRPTCAEQAMYMSIFLHVLDSQCAKTAGAETSTWAPEWTRSNDPSGRATAAHAVLIDGGGW